MKLESQVCSLELAKQLKELGVKQESAFYRDEFGHLHDIPYLEKYSGHHYTSAFTVAELGEMLPDQWNSFELVIERFENEWDIRYVERMADGDETRGERFCDTNEANCRASMLIHLLTQGILKLEDVNGN